MRAWVALSLVVVVTAALTEEEPVNRGVQTSRGLALEQEREHGGPEGAGGVLRKRKEGTGTVQKTQKEEQGKRSRGMKKVCPGRCVDGPRQCVRGRTVRSSRCGKQVCCITASKNTRQDADGDNSEIERKRNRCSPRRACRKIKGKCQQDGRKCPPGTQPYQNTKQTRYCKKKNCVCCAKVGDGCTTKSKCSDKKGYCTKDPKRCEGRFKKSKNFCSGADCVCCLPSKPCKTKYECEDYGGECMNLKTGHCYTEPLVGKKYCKGRNCGCCVPEDDPTKWGYEKKNGPATWPGKFPTCGGKKQSPVALKTADAMGSFPFIPFNFRNYNRLPTQTELMNNGHTAMAMVTLAEPASVVGGNLEGEYTFLQYHFHWGKDVTEGSEHTIDGRKFLGEIHLVHFKTSLGSPAEALKFADGLAVLGILLEVSYHDNPVLNPIIAGLAKIRKADARTNIQPVPLQNLLPKNVDDFFRYEGSLTTPTCNEIVIWTVFKDTVKISLRQLAQFRFLKDDDGNRLVENFRPVQPLNGREVLMGRRTPYWSYIPPFDPTKWPISFPTCGTVRQSPVALVTADAKGNFPRLTLGFQNYDVTPTGLTMMNNGHTAQIMPQFPSGIEVTMAGGDLEGKYVVLQFHFHWGAIDTRGSEHTIDGKSFPIEVHIVHYKQSYGNVAEALKFGDGVAVLGIMGTVGTTDNPKLQAIIDGLSKIHEAEEKTELIPFPLQNLLPENTEDFFRYEGSLTTPTCNEIVIWTVFTNTISISFKQLAEFRKLMDEGGMILQDNFRPPQPLSGREVLLASPKMHWSYIGATAADKWSSIFPSCIGTRQSPIALDSSSSVPGTGVGTLSFTNYDKLPTKMPIRNNGHTAQTMVESSAVPSFSGTGLEDYTFLQFHFHWGKDDTLGSEHTINGKRFPAEIHLVHYKTSYGTVAEALKFGDGVAVLGVMLEVAAADNPKLQNVINSLANIHVAETESEVVPFPLMNLLPTSEGVGIESIFRYEGSLTTPTCNEIVIWTVFKDPIEISQKQLAEFRKLEDESGLPLVDNFRPLQDLVGRTVTEIKA